VLSHSPESSLTGSRGRELSRAAASGACCVTQGPDAWIALTERAAENPANLFSPSPGEDSTECMPCISMQSPDLTSLLAEFVNRQPAPNSFVFRELTRRQGCPCDPHTPARGVLRSLDRPPSFGLTLPPPPHNSAEAVHPGLSERRPSIAIPLIRPHAGPSTVSRVRIDQAFAFACDDRLRVGRVLSRCSRGPCPSLSPAGAFSLSAL
jgi:hypothetical protein